MIRNIDYEEADQFLKDCPTTYIPALLHTIIKRCSTEPIFKGWMGMHTFIQRAYKKDKQ